MNADSLVYVERAARDWTERQIAICGNHTVRAELLRAIEKRGLTYAKTVGLEDWQMIDEMEKAVDLFNDLAGATAQPYDRAMTNQPDLPKISVEADQLRQMRTLLESIWRKANQ